MNAIVLLALAMIPRAEPPLPEGAVGRLGSPAWRGVAADVARSFITFTPDAKGHVVAYDDALRALDFDTGRELWKITDDRSYSRPVSVPGGRLFFHGPRGRR